MTRHQSPTDYFPSIPRPPCPKCSTVMTLTGIEPDTLDHDRRTFECTKWAHSESVVVKYM
jgi:hypothetical protein